MRGSFTIQYRARPYVAGWVCTKLLQDGVCASLCAGRGRPISTLHVGPDQPDANPTSNPYTLYTRGYITFSIFVYTLSSLYNKPYIMTRPTRRTGLHENVCRSLISMAEAGLSAERDSSGKRHNNRSRVTAPADIEPPKRLGSGLGLGLGVASGWSGPTCKVEIGRPRPAQSDVQTPFFFSSFFILRRMGKNKALAHHTSTYFHTRRVSI